MTGGETLEDIYRNLLFREQTGVDSLQLSWSGARRTRCHFIQNGNKKDEKQFLQLRF